MKTPPTSCGQITLIRLPEFFQRVPRVKTEAPFHFFNACLTYGGPVFLNADGIDTYESRYERRGVILQKGNEFEILRAQLTAQFRFEWMAKTPWLNFVEDIAIKHLEEYGSGEFMIRLAPRRWAIVNPDDFRIYEGPHGIALACEYQMRCTAFERFPYTQEKLNAIAQAIKEGKIF